VRRGRPELEPLETGGEVVARLPGVLDGSELDRDVIDDVEAETLDCEEPVAQRYPVPCGVVDLVTVVMDDPIGTRDVRDLAHLAQERLQFEVLGGTVDREPFHRDLPRCETALHDADRVVGRPVVDDVYPDSARDEPVEGLGDDAGLVVGGDDRQHVESRWRRSCPAQVPTVPHGEREARVCRCRLGPATPLRTHAAPDGEEPLPEDRPFARGDHDARAGRCRTDRLAEA
jgi:hypothetical protein